MSSNRMASEAGSVYSTAVTPFKASICGIPVTTFVASCASAGMYLTAALIMLATNCPFTNNVIYFFAFLMVALVAIIAMTSANVYQSRYRFNCSSLTVSLLFSGSAALILLGLIMSAVSGLCAPSGTSTGSLFTSKHVGNYFIWFITAFGLAFQVVAHYYYG